MTAQPIARPTPMTSKGVEVRREGRDGSRYYADPSTEELYASVTTVISATTSKPWLADWTAKLASQCAVDNLELLPMLVDADGPDAAVDFLKGAARRRREEASERGTWVHDVVEALVLDTALPEMSEEVQQYAEAFIDWCIEWEPVFLMSECAVANPARGHAGTLDLVCDLPALGKRFMIDVKSGQNLDAYMPVQMSAYRRSTEVWLPFGQKAPMLQVDACAVLHVRPGGAKLIEVDAGPDEYAVFLRMLEVLDWKERQKGRMGRVLYFPLPDGSQPPALLEDLDLVPARAALATGGIHRIDQLADAAADPERLLALKGFGPGALAALPHLLVAHDRPVPDALTAALIAIEEKAAAAAARKAERDAKKLAAVPA